jgi:aryl-alcohol dehydrogenase-like predicted oxidoreductase
VLGLAVYVNLPWIELVNDTHFNLSASPVHAMQSMSLIQRLQNDVCSYCAINKDYAIANKLTPFISMQNHHSLIYREEEREMFPTLKVRKTPLHRYLALIRCCKLFGVGSIPWSSLGRGLLTRPLDDQTKRGSTDQ